jgi:hypothetical protein
MVNTLSSVGHLVSFETTQLCHGSRKAVEACGWVLAKPAIFIGVGWIWHGSQACWLLANSAVPVFFLGFELKTTVTKTPTQGGAGGGVTGILWSLQYFCKFEIISKWCSENEVEIIWWLCAIFGWLLLPLLPPGDWMYSWCHHSEPIPWTQPTPRIIFPCPLCPGWKMGGSWHHIRTRKTNRTRCLRMKVSGPLPGF